MTTRRGFLKLVTALSPLTWWGGQSGEAEEPPEPFHIAILMGGPKNGDSCYARHSTTILEFPHARKNGDFETLVYRRTTPRRFDFLGPYHIMVTKTEGTVSVRSELFAACLKAKGKVVLKTNPGFEWNVKCLKDDSIPRAE